MLHDGEISDGTAIVTRCQESGRRCGTGGPHLETTRVIAATRLRG
jgi:hypothetical protein